MQTARETRQVSLVLCDSRTPREAVSRVHRNWCGKKKKRCVRVSSDKRELKTLYKIQAGRRTAPPIRGDNPPGSCQISLLRDDTPAVPGHAAVRTESARQTRPAKHDCTEGDAVCTTGDAMSVPVVDTHPSLGVLPHRVRGSPTHTAARGGEYLDR
ncbi:hypothetical protein J6590_003155 [Homalodisca vitripennis]|nr:hypothetical protein J6590_003155 [Homalodisca vitripennis]